MINRVSFPHTPPSSRDINPAHNDPMNQGVDGTKLEPQTTFFYDTIMAEFRSFIYQAAENSVLTASVFIVNSDIVKELISIENFEQFFTHLNETLGFITDSRSMTSSYPDYKRASLLAPLQSSE